MEKLIVTVEDVKNELGLDLGAELDMQPRLVTNWLKRIQRTILNHIAKYAYNGMSQVERILCNPRNVAVVKEAIMEQIDYLATNNFVQADKVMNTNGQTVEPFIAPLAHQVLSNAGLLYAGAGF